ncbi:hypothetical protein [Clostridium sp.]|uniref:hypothetical protein n=1 Tax=Clostridium sp. TaxID=1506 RepID=UPI0029119697|nr:hypothetical protein [Clostridium sp.]MDU4476649.1 hypothetical protein [Clostridium sp.]
MMKRKNVMHISQFYGGRAVMPSGWIINFESGQRIIYTEEAYEEYMNSTQIWKIRSEEHWFSLEQAIKENPTLEVKRTINEKIKLLNKLEIIDYSISTDEIEYLEIEDNERNVEILKTLGATNKEFEIMRDSTDGSLEISEFAFKFANWFSTKDGFSLEEINKKFKNGDIVMIIAPKSRYAGLIGEVINYDKELKVYIVDTKIVKVGIHEDDLMLNAD